ncbi:MAG: hypothetical protein ACLR0F_05130 [Eisenbergiella sp.]
MVCDTPQHQRNRCDYGDFRCGRYYEQQFRSDLCIQNAFNLERSEVIDTYIYKVGLQQLQFGMAAAINIFKSVLAITLLFTANRVSNKLTDSGLF